MSARNDNVPPEYRPIRLPDGAPLDYAPNNEQGVVFLFSDLARKRFGLRVESVQAGFPDCIAYRGSKRIRIEFEYYSSNFATHRHPAAGCDWIVCWIHDWPGAPKSLRIVELRREFGVGFSVWFQPVSGEYAAKLGKSNSWDSWSVPSQAMEGDLLLFYRTAPESCVRDVFRVAGPVGHVEADWKGGLDYMAAIHRVCTLKAPLHWSEMCANSVIKEAGFIRGKMRGRYRASEYWPELYQMIVSRNPNAERELKMFGPDRLA